MQVEWFQYELGSDSWSSTKLPELDSEQTLMLAFGASEIQGVPAVLQAVRRRFPRSHILGCSTAGEMLNGKLSDSTLSVAVMKFQHCRLATASVVVRHQEQSTEAGTTLGQQLAASTQPSAVILLCEGLRIDHEGLFSGLHSVLGPDVPVVGALAADGRRYERTWVWSGDRVQSGLCAAVGLYGPHVVLRSVMNDKWGKASDAEIEVTKAEANIIYELDGKPAMNVCQVPGSGLRPLELVDDGSILCPISANPVNKSVAFHRRVSTGTRVRPRGGAASDLLAGAAEAAKAVREQVLELSSSGDGALVLTTSCIGRRMFLDKRATDEVEILSGLLPPDVVHIGLYSYGELSPGPGNEAAIHYTSFGIAVLSESLDLARADTPERPPPALERDDTDTDMEVRMRTLSAVSAVTRELGSATATVYELGTLRFIALSGMLNESFRYQGLVPDLHGRVALDLAGIEHITSFGIRGWLEMMSACDAALSSLYIANCSEAVVNQMLMIRNFAGKGHVASFGAPYICTVCSMTFDFLLDCEHSAAEIEAAEPPDVACPECGNRGVFDEDPESYLSFVSEYVGIPLPTDVRGALAERRLEWMTQVDEAIEKQVLGNRTDFRINRAVDEKIRWSRVLAGVEGTVRLDFTRSTGATPLGAERCLSGLRGTVDVVDAIILDQVPLAIVERLVEVEPIPKLKIRTVSVPARCTNCGVIRQASIDPAGIREARRQGLQPESECRRCSGSIPIALPDRVVDYFEGRSSRSNVSVERHGGFQLPSLYLVIGGALVAIIVVVIAIAMS